MFLPVNYTIIQFQLSIPSTVFQVINIKEQS